MENEKKNVEETKVQEQATNMPVPQETEEVKKPNIFKRGLGWVKRNGKTIAKGAGLVLAGVVAGAFVGALASKRNEDGGETSDDYSGDDYDWQPEPEDDETENEENFDFSDEETDEEEAS